MSFSGSFCIFLAISRVLFVFFFWWFLRHFKGFFELCYCLLLGFKPFVRIVVNPNNTPEGPEEGPQKHLT